MSQLPIIVSSLIFLGVLVLILTERVHRTTAAIVGAVIMVLVGIGMGFYSETEAVASIDFPTLELLLGMMILVALLEPTGFIEFLAIWVAKHSHGQPVRLLVLLGAVTTVTSMFLDNVTTVVLVAPVTILICEIVGLNPRPYLIAEAVLSNTGGAATLVGDPPNVLIGSAANLTFLDFLTYSLPVIAVCWLAALWVFVSLVRKELLSTERQGVALDELNPWEALRDRKVAVKVLVTLALAVLFFFAEELIHLRPSLVAISAMALGLVWVKPDVSETLKRVPWDILLFFGALFVMVGGLEHSGAMDMLAVWIEQLAQLPPVVTGLVLLWLVAILSSIVDNVPITIALIPVLLRLEADGMNVTPLWWALVFGAGLGGNGTIIGATANVVVVSLSEKTRTPITPKLWLRRGLPVMLVTLVVASGLYALMWGVLLR
ncbi:MAG: ArsB/NhaD family transporter [Anaerolineae bacterium]|nr:ArsB/NhaD family transporter [Anaerolineae bacterium]